MQRHIVNGRHGFHPAVEVARHPVSRAEVKLFIASVGEVKQARMLEKPADDADDSDPITDPRNSGPQAADATDDQIDLHACL